MSDGKKAWAEEMEEEAYRARVKKALDDAFSRLPPEVLAMLSEEQEDQRLRLMRRYLHSRQGSPEDRYPEHARLYSGASGKDFYVILAFLAWAKRRHNAQLYVVGTDARVPMHLSAEQLAHEFLGIDMAMLGAEQVQMAKEIFGK